MTDRKILVELSEQMDRLTKEKRKRFKSEIKVMIEHAESFDTIVNGLKGFATREASLVVGNFELMKEAIDELLKETET